MSSWSKCVRVLVVLGIVALTACGSGQAPKPTPAWAGETDPLALVSRDSLFATLSDLTAIQAYSGWRQSGTEGERQALDYVAGQLDQLAQLKAWGLEIEREQFRVFMTTEVWESRLSLQAGGQNTEVPVSAIRGSRDVITRAVHFDSDGSLGDTARNPVIVTGGVRAVRTAQELEALPAADVQGRVVFVDYALFDSVTEQKEGLALERSEQLLKLGPAAVVLVTQYTNKAGQSHGTFAGENGGAMGNADVEPYPPVLFVRLEDLAPAGVKTWDDLPRVESAQLTWDADVLSPAESGNLVARIPGANSSKALILGAHVDSPNNPGAMDDGSGVATLLEVARVVDAAKLKPAADLYLVFFGSEETGLYGSHHFVNTHQELLDRTVAMLVVDCLSRPVEDLRDMKLQVSTWSYARQGDPQLTWPFYLQDALAAQGIEVKVQELPYPDSDNTSFAGYDIPNLNLTYLDDERMPAYGGVHYAGHLHDPYDTVELAAEVGDVLERMARAAVVASLYTAAEVPALRVPDAPKQRAVFVAGHTEAVHLTPAELTDVGMTLAWEGFDVDLIPYGRMVTAEDLTGAALVVVLPVQDYPCDLAGNTGAYDEAWSDAEIEALEQYVARGGFLVLTNSAYRMKHANRPLADANEDWADMNALAGSFGITYLEGPVSVRSVAVTGTAPFRRGISDIEFANGNAVAFSITEGQVLAENDAGVLMALVDHGEGQVLAFADVGVFGGDPSWGSPSNLVFWSKLAEYASAR